MEIAVVGASGTLGRPTVSALAARGHAVRVLGRRAAGPDAFAVDLRAGTGLDRALEGVDVLVDASNAGPRVKAARAVLVEGGRRLLEVARREGVRHHLCVSIVGSERVPLGYYRVKVEQEEVVEAAGVPFTIVRSTQFHSLLAGLFAAAARRRVLPTGRLPLQPVDPAEVAEALADVAEAAPLGRRVEVAGPETTDLSSLARVYRAHTRRRTLLLPVVAPVALGRALRSGALTTTAPDRRGTARFAEWLEHTL
jgi:uncharacterized protein YbjT (DUF2867 family)